VVACEDIERSARDTFNALKIEKELARNGIMLAATDEPPQIEGANATMILVRRVKQGVAEWYRLQLREKIWKGLQEHHLAGWNTGPIPYGYAPDRHPHPNPMKAGLGLTRHKLTADPDTVPWCPRSSSGASWTISRSPPSPAGWMSWVPPAPAGSGGAAALWTRSFETRSTPGTWCGAGRRGTARAAAPPR
jgi:hypothetical protein